METFIILLLVVLCVVGISHAAAGALWQLALLIATIYGIVKAWQAHWLFGLIALFVSPVGLVIGIASLIARRNVAYDIVRALRS
jgi:hypothetical protein